MSHKMTSPFQTYIIVNLVDPVNLVDLAVNYGAPFVSKFVEFGDMYILTVYIYHGIYIDQSDFQYSDYSAVAVIIIIIIVCMRVH